MADELPPLRKEAMSPRSGNSIYGPLAAMATVMMLSIASLMAVMSPHRACPHATRGLSVTVESVPAATHDLIAPAAANEIDAIDPQIVQESCRGPVYRAGADGNAEVVFELCAGARPPIKIVEH